jgi:hypothetical protein
MENLYTIERFEEDYAVCITLNGRQVNIPFETIPANSVVGDVLRFVAGEYQKVE